MCWVIAVTVQYSIPPSVMVVRCGMSLARVISIIVESFMEELGFYSKTPLAEKLVGLLVSGASGQCR